MKPFPVLVAFLLALLPCVKAQNFHSDSASGVRIDILIPGGEYKKIDGRNSEPAESRFKAGLKLETTTYGSSGIKPVFIERKRNHLKSETGLSDDDQFYRFLENNLPETGLSSPRENFRITRINSDHLGITHIRSVQFHNGIEVYGSEAVLHIDPEKERLTGSLHKLPEEISAEPVIEKTQAVDLVINDLKRDGRFRELSKMEKDFLDYDQPSAVLNYFTKAESSYRLTWIITLRPNFVDEWKYFIDATDGKILLKYNNTKTDGPARGTGWDLNNMMRTFNVYETSGIYYLYDISQRMFNPVTKEGIIITLDGNSTSTLNLDYAYVTSADNTWSQKSAISAHCNAAKTYQYFDTTFNRISINGKGGNIISIVNIVNDDGTPMENAFWNGQAVFYGTGGIHFKPVAGSLDVTAHELSHGVISSTANLDYYGQPGAINESFADIFACMIDRDDWTIGEDITLESYSPSGVIRDLSNPHNKGTSADRYWQPTHTTEMYIGAEDNGGIHLNSGIVNYAYYVFAERIGKNKAEKVFYRALTEYLTKTSGFIDLRLAVVQSARDLFGDLSTEMHEAEWAFESVGIYEEEYVDKTAVFETNPGEQMLLTSDTNPNDPVSLYMSTAQGTNYRPLINSPMLSKVSVTDDGTTAVFVSSERRIRMFNTGADVDERIISGFNYYDNVALSKDGKRLAATRGFSDASIYVIDLVSGAGRQFILYNPTTNPDMVDAGGVLKAYSVEFDLTGEYLIYDAYNVINSNSAKDINYWDIGFIKVWDNETGNFGNGLITKLFSALPAHVNVANPVFSKNSPNILAFDYFYDDGILENYSVRIANIENGKTGIIAVNDRLGYPSFSTNDDYLAYSTINSSNMQVVKSVRLSADKMAPAGEAGVLVPDAKWPVYFTRGKRSLGLSPVSDFTADFKYGNYPVKTRFLDISANKPDSWLWKFEGGSPSESVEQNPSIIFELPGFYSVTLITSNEFGSDTLIRERYIHAINPTSLGTADPINPDIYPNPVSEELHINITGEFSVMILNIQGEIVLRSQNSSIMDVSGLKPGIYLVDVKSDKESYKRKFVKK